MTVWPRIVEGGLGRGLHSERRGRVHNTGRPREVKGQVGWVWGIDRTPEIKDFKCESSLKLLHWVHAEG